jgi:hypothetical protein
MEAVPMHNIVNVGFVSDIDVDVLPFAQAQEWSRDRAVIGEHVNRLAGREFETQRRNVKPIVRRSRGLAIGACEAGTNCRPCRPDANQKFAAIGP